MNRIPVVNDEQRASYGAPTTDVGAGQAPELAPALVEPEPEPALVEPEPALVDKKTSKKKSA